MDRLGRQRRESYRSGVKSRRKWIPRAALAVLACTTLADRGLAAAPAIVGEPIHSMYLEGTRLHLGLEKNGGPEYLILDVRNPGSPQAVFQSEIGATVTEICVDGRDSYLATENPAAEIIVIDSRADRRVAEIDLPGETPILQLAPVWGGGVGVLRVPQAGVDNSFHLDRREKDELRIVGSHFLPRVASSEATLMPQFADTLPAGSLVDWVRHPDDEDLTMVALRVAKDPFRLLRGAEDRLRLVDRDGDGTIRLACVGDSNTAVSPTVFPGSWCRTLGKEVWHRDLEVLNHSRIGASLRSFVARKRGAVLLEEALAERPDAVILALGTNDLNYFHADGIEADARDRVGKIKELEARTRATGADFFVALVPPRFDAAVPEGSLAALNAAIRKEWPPEKILDFHSEIGRELLDADGVHFLGAGHVERARRAYAFILEPERASP